MPGRNLNNDERYLLGFWDAPPNNLARPLLRAIEIDGGNGLRALNSVRIPFNYPITAICGKNGTGKSTALALAALAFHTPPNWYVPWTNARFRSSKTKEDRSYHIFQDFFVYGRDEQPPNGVQITWRYFANGAEASLQFRKTASRWGAYSRRPERELAYSPLSRMIPAYEMNSVRGVFREPGAPVATLPFDQEYRGYLAYVMGVNYQDVDVQRTDRLNFANCRTGMPYSGFNMGGGENCAVELFHLLRSLPPCGLLVIEEIESCLHPEAQVRLAEVLVRICRKKKVQIVCSTHSEVFLDALPRQARLLLKREEGNSAVIEGPSTRFAIYEMKGEIQPELTIYCEDGTAAVLIEEAIEYADRIRLRIIDVGSNVTVVRQAVCHLRGGFPGECLCVLDGDCSPQQVQGWIASESGFAQNINPAFEILPGNNLSPERWVLDQLAHEDYRNQFAAQLGCRRDQAREHITAMGVELNHHDIAYTLERRTGFDKTECTRRIMRSVARNHPGLDALKARIAGLLG
jgi:AAA domain, putative AbiEii toxin, Type IV TA system